jgi:large subunit ribosomal protein L40
MRELPKLTFEEMEERAQMTKEWTKYKQKQNATQMAAIRGLLQSQQRALDELQSESKELYLEASKSMAMPTVSLNLKLLN